jgi:hypothetical protein
METVTIRGGSANNAYNVERIAATMTVGIVGGNGADTVHVTRPRSAWPTSPGN